MCVLDLPTELQNAKTTVTLLKSDSPTDAPPAVWKILGTIKGNIYGRWVVGVVGGWIGKLEFFIMNATRDIFLIIFQNVHSSIVIEVSSTFFFKKHNKKT